MSLSSSSPVFTQALVAAERCSREGMPLTAETLHSMDPELPITVAEDALGDERFARALEELGVNHTPTQRITSEQLNAAKIYLAAPKSASHQSRLRAAGITQAKWNGWMRQPEFARYLGDGAMDVFRGSLPAAQLAVADKATKGEPWAVQMLFRLTGFDDPNQQADPNALLMAVFEILSDEGVDTEVLRKVAGRVRELAAPQGAQQPQQAMLVASPQGRVG